MTYDLAHRVEFLRQAAYVKRMHVNRIIGDYTSHEHVCNMTNMLLVLHPAPTVRLVKLVQWHDAGEFGSGDVPSPAKPFFGFGNANNKVEAAVRKAWGLELLDVTDEEALWVKSLDWLEFYMFLMDQLFLGNQFMSPIAASFQLFLDDAIMAQPVRDYYLTIRDGGRPTVSNDWLMEELPKDEEVAA